MLIRILGCQHSPPHPSSPTPVGPRAQRYATLCPDPVRPAPRHDITRSESRTASRPAPPRHEQPHMADGAPRSPCVPSGSPRGARAGVVCSRAAWRGVLSALTRLDCCVYLNSTNRRGSTVLVGTAGLAR